MTLDEIKAKLPAQWKPVVDQYGPAFVAMTAEEVWAWLILASKGDVYAAHSAVLQKLPNTELLGQWDQANADWQAANEKNAARIAWQRDALMAVLKVLVAIAAASVGL